MRSCLQPTFNKKLGNGLAAIDLDGVNSIMVRCGLRYFEYVCTAICDKLKAIIFCDGYTILQPHSRYTRFRHLTHKAHSLSLKALSVAQWPCNVNRTFWKNKMAERCLHIYIQFNSRNTNFFYYFIFLLLTSNFIWLRNIKKIAEYRYMYTFVTR